MALVKFSSTLPEFNGDLKNAAIIESHKALEALGERELPFLRWSENYVAVPFEIKVEVPSLGNYNNLEILDVEPVLIAFSLSDYPSTAPRVFSDRINFPKDQLAHLYVAVMGRPPGFCYVLGDVNDWYANKRIEDLITRISNWLQDAATGKLSNSDEQFEPLRLESYSGTVIYDYDSLIEIINKRKVPTENQDLLLSLFEADFGKLIYKFNKSLAVGNASNIEKEIFEDQKKEINDPTKKNYRVSCIIWNKKGVVNSEYCVDLPKNWEEFKNFCQLYRVEYGPLERLIPVFAQHGLAPLPVIIGIRRPYPIIGFSSNFEFLNFSFEINKDDVKNDEIINNFRIRQLRHSQPLTKAMASRISGTVEHNLKTAVFGCGALGSKVIMHLARSGQSPLTLVDPDTLSPHNLVRHTLYGEDEGKNKANALAEKIKKIFPGEDTKIVGIPNSISMKDFTVIADVHDRLLDFTASDAFFNDLINDKKLDKLLIASASISDHGNLGIMFVEGKNREPKIDDLQAYLFSLATDDVLISEWLQREKESQDRNNLNLQIGVGCNSETTVLSDEKISTHASFFTSVLKREKGSKTEGTVYLSRIFDLKEYRIETQAITVEPFQVFSVLNDSAWVIRMTSGICETLEKLFKEAGSNETGGVFIGTCNYKTKTIHVINIIRAPKDSTADKISFLRGRDGLSEKIDEVYTKSGGQVGYIGEWHSHPVGPDYLSVQDMKTVEEHKEELSKLTPPLPVFISILTPNGLQPYIF